MMFQIRLKQLREERSLSQSAFAKELGIAQSTVGNWESGTREPNIEMIRKLADYFGVSMDYLIGYDNNKKTLGKESNIFMPKLTAKDERDISKRINEVLTDLGSGDEALMFDGEPLELDDETRRLLIDSLENSIRVGKLIAKQKYTPKKYRKDNLNET